GTKDIVVWAEPDIWDEKHHTPIAAPITPVTIDLPSPASVAVYDPLKGSAPVQVLGSTSRIVLNVTDHPLIVELKGPAGGGPDKSAAANAALGPAARPRPAGRRRIARAA